MKTHCGTADLAGMYVGLSMSLTDISKSTGVALSTVRSRLHRLAMLRTRADGLRIASAQGKLSTLAGSTRRFSDEWRANISKSARLRGESSAGTSLKPSGYVEITRGPNKGRLQHVVVMEVLIGRPLAPHECVHHKDENRSNNDPSNLELLTRSEHSRLHATQAAIYRKRKHNGQFE